MYVQVPGIKDGSQRCLHRIDRTVNLFQISDSVTTMAESFNFVKGSYFWVDKEKGEEWERYILAHTDKIAHTSTSWLITIPLPNLPCDRDTRSVHERGQLESHAM
jgi:hypothetical protein